MFTGIIENTGTITNIENKGSNRNFTLTCPFTSELKIDQSLAHNGVCLTVVAINGNQYTVTAIEETLLKTNLRTWETKQKINLERCMPANGRFDGHIVQGHVDQTAQCTAIEDKNGSWLFSFEFDGALGNIVVEKGSICVNGVSLTVVNAKNNGFSVAIIPYTFEFTNFSTLQLGSIVNLEFDIIGKYLARLINR